jgi:hypothetical protein
MSGPTFVAQCSADAGHAGDVCDVTDGRVDVASGSL